MSIKSQKSLNEECSEIVEKSYSVRSASEDSLSCEDEDESLARDLMNKMTPAVLSKLRRCFRKNKERNQARDIDRRVEEVMRAAAAEEGIEFSVTAPVEDALCLDEGAFVTALENIFGSHKYTTHAHKLFRVLDPFSSGRVRWRQLVARLVAAGAKRTTSRLEEWQPLENKGVMKMGYCKRETIVKLLNIEREDSFCYVAVSKGGKVGIYSGQLKFLHSYEVFYHRTGVRRRVKNCWITDAIYLSDVQYLILSASDRSLIIYDATTLSHTPVYCLTGIPNIPTCLAYSPSTHPGASSELAFGTERGDVVLLRFLQPRVQFLYTKASDTINYYFWMELPSPPHSSYCSITTWRRVHSRSIRRVAYTRDGDILLSCSHDSTVSVRSRHVQGKLNDYVFKVQRGVSCFHVVYPLHLLATGSCDGAVRLWETSQSLPFAVLMTPTAPAVLDVAIIAAQEIVIAFCNNCTVHIWDIYEECLLQSIKIKFPFLGVLGKKVEFGAYCIHPGPLRKKLEEDPSEAMLGTASRRGSSVYQGSTGGLMLQPETRLDWQNRRLEDEPEYTRFDRCSVLLTCCDHVCTVSLRAPRGGIPAPPGDTLRPRRPSAWDLPDLTVTTSAAPAAPPRAPRAPPPRAPPPRTLTPTATHYQLNDLETLLENAGLKGILERDFVLMQGLKHDLNRKMAEMEAKRDTMRCAVSAGAPYLSLTIHSPAEIEPVDEMTDEYRRIMRLFPGPSVEGTPSGSETSTPRCNRSSRI